MTVLDRIKRIVLAGRFELSEKARIEMFSVGLIEQDLVEAIANARKIDKTLRSSNPFNHKREHLYVIISQNLHRVRLYTKGKIVELDGVETYYFFVSAKYAD